MNKEKQQFNRESWYQPKVRQKWYYLVDKCGWSVKRVNERYGVPRKTYYKWYKKDHDASHYPKKEHPNTKLTSEVKIFIETEKRKTNYGPKKMKLLVKKQLGIDLSTTIIYRYYKRKKLIRKPQKKLPWYQPMKEKLVITKAGEGVQCDVKYVYEQGIRKYQFSVLDQYTKKYHFTIFDRRFSRNAIVALEKAEKYFGFKIVSVQTDNGSEYRGDFHNWCEKEKIMHYFIPKKSPWWNGSIERVHRTIDDEYYHNPLEFGRLQVSG